MNYLSDNDKLKTIWLTKFALSSGCSGSNPSSTTATTTPAPVIFLLQTSITLYVGPSSLFWRQAMQTKTNNDKMKCQNYSKADKPAVFIIESISGIIEFDKKVLIAICEYTAVKKIFPSFPFF